MRRRSSPPVAMANSATPLADYDPAAGMLLIRAAKGGRSRHVYPNDEGLALFERLAAGRSSSDFVLTNEAGGQWAKSMQIRRMRQACRAARLPHMSFHGLRHTNAALSVMGGMSLQITAASLGHADSRLTERFYAHLSPDHIAKEVRRASPRFGLGSDEHVVPVTPVV